MFKNQRFITKGVGSEIPLLLQMYIWALIDTMEIQKDYLQVFRLYEEKGRQIIEHTQEQPEYKRVFTVKSKIKPITAKVFVIDDETHTTMLLASEY